PDWLKCALKFIIAQKVEGQTWVEMINMWVELDRRLRHPSQDGADVAHRLGNKDRPEQVSIWMRYGRQYDKPPEIPSLDEFSTSWRKWWTALQPAWRKNSQGPDWPLLLYNQGPDDESWPGVAKGGKNGFHIVIVTLLWW
ncbi:hypothetical protein BD410DRAFT_700676, partial [Rickenella mellea]